MMSAVAVTENELFVRSRRRLGEIEAVYQISRHAANGITLEDTLQKILSAALLVSGIACIEFVPGKALHRLVKSPVRVSIHSANDVLGSAVTELLTDRKKWGDLRIYFELDPVPIENPLLFARYIAEQIRNLAQRFHLQADRLHLREKAARFEKIVRRRKALRRAIAILMNTHNITEGQSLVMLRRYARQSGHGLLQISDAIILGDRQRWNSDPIRFPAKRTQRFPKVLTAAAGR